MYARNTSQNFDISEWVEFNRSGRGECPSCASNGYKGYKARTLSLVPGTAGAYKCHRGCTPEEIRAALGAPLPRASGLSDSLPYPKPKKLQVVPQFKTDYTVDAQYVRRSVERLLLHKGEPQQQALAWLEKRGLSRGMIQHYQLGLERRVIIPNEQHPAQKETYWAIAIFIPVPNRPGRYYKKMRVAPWLVGDDRPSYLSNWSQYGVSTTVFVTYKPENAIQTWMCEGEWDAMRLGWEALQQGSQIAIACSTGGCNTVPKPEQLDQLPGDVIIFYDRNDLLRKDGTRAGDEGAEKLAMALPNRGRIGAVPMPEDCPIKGWDVSNALDAGYSWLDFQAAAQIAAAPNFTQSIVSKHLDDRSRQTPSKQQSLNGDSDWVAGNGGNGNGGNGPGDGNGNHFPPHSSDLVHNQTVEALIFDTLFEKGKGNWKTLEDSFYYYQDDGHWQRIRDKQVLKAIGLKCKSAYELKEKKDSLCKVYSFFTEAKKKSAFQLCRDSLDVGEIPDNSHLLCFRNCTVDLRTGEKLPHDPKHFLTAVIDADYEPNQLCPEVFLDFIKSAYGEDLIDVIRAYTSMLLDPTAPYGKFIHLMGPSGSGKGTLLRLWGSMFGCEHFRSGEFSNLATAEGRHQQLTGTSLFAVPDVGGYVQGLKAFYELVDNGPMTGRALFSSNAYQKTWNTRFVIASVSHLNIENSGDGWDRRCLPLLTKPRQGIEDPHLGAKLEALKGQIISWALAMPREERDQILLTPSSNERIMEAKQDAAIYGDPVRAFIDLCLRPNDSFQPLPSHELHSLFNAFCTAHGYAHWGMTKLINHLKTIIPNHYVSRRRARVRKDPNRGMIPAFWGDIEVLKGAFNKVDSNGEQVWRCVKSGCMEGGLIAFKEWGESDSPDDPPPTPPPGGNSPRPNNGSPTGDGSAISTNGSLVADPSESTHYQALQKMDHLDQLDHLGGEGVNNAQKVAVENWADATPLLEVEPSTLPLDDLDDPSDPKNQTELNQGVEADHSVVDINASVADPTQAADPQVSLVWQEIIQLLSYVDKVAELEIVEEQATQLGLPQDWKQRVWPSLDVNVQATLKRLKRERKAQTAGRGFASPVVSSESNPPSQSMSANFSEQVMPEPSNTAGTIHWTD